MLEASEFEEKKRCVNSKGFLCFFFKKDFSITWQQAKEITKKYPTCSLYKHHYLKEVTQSAEGQWSFILSLVLFLIRCWLASSQAGSIGGAMVTRQEGEAWQWEFWEEEVWICSCDPDAADARCDCPAKKGTMPCGSHRQELWANISYNS